MVVYGPNAVGMLDVNSYSGRPTPGHQEPWQPRPPLGVASVCSLTYFSPRRPQWEARWSHLHPSRLSNLLELTNSSVRKQQKPVHDPDLALPVCWCNFLLGRRPMNQRCLTIYPYHVGKFKTTVTCLIMHIAQMYNQHVSLKSWFFETLHCGTVVDLHSQVFA